jgi:hypothetical protein
MFSPHSITSGGRKAAVIQFSMRPDILLWGWINTANSAGYSQHMRHIVHLPAEADALGMEIVQLGLLSLLSYLSNSTRTQSLRRAVASFPENIT